MHIILLLFVLAFYFIPTSIAMQRETKNLGAIVMINLFFGWTILGWIAALLWAIAEGKEEQGLIEEPFNLRYTAERKS